MPPLDTTPGNSGKRRSPFTRNVVAVFLLVMAAALFVHSYSQRGLNAWQRYKNELEARGEKLDWRAWLPPAPPPDNENFSATHLLQAIGVRGQTDPVIWGRFQALPLQGSLGLTGDFEKGERADLEQVQANLRVSAGSADSFPPLPQEPAADVMFALKPVEVELNELRGAALRPYAQLKLRFPDPISQDMPNYVVFRELSQLLVLKAVAELRLSKTDDAFADVRTICRLADAANSSPTLVSAMIHCAIYELALQPFWEGWVTGRWTDGQLEAFQSVFQKPDLMLTLDSAMRGGERAGMNYLMESLPPKKLSRIFGGAGTDWPSRLIDFGTRFGGVVRQNQLTFNRLLDETYFDNYDLGKRRVFPKICRESSVKLEKAVARPTPNNYLAFAMIPNFVRALQTVAHHQTFLDLAGIACALERYRRAYGGYPESLDALMPQFVKSLPHDLITGKPVKYRRIGDGKFFLYSVGWNETDDGGISGKDGESGDWVWPCRVKQ